MRTKRNIPDKPVSGGNYPSSPEGGSLGCLVATFLQTRLRFCKRGYGYLMNALLGGDSDVAKGVLKGLDLHRVHNICIPWIIWICFLCCIEANANPFLTEIRPYLRSHCVPCHGPDKQKGDLRLDVLGNDFSDRASASIWIEVRDLIHLGEMPPEDKPRPDIVKTERVTNWIAQNLRQLHRQAHAVGDRVPLRRMNRHEYTHTIADLLSLKFPAGESPLDVLPPDGTAEGFDKVSAALLLDPSLMELYYRVARGIADKAIVEGPPDYPTETMRLEFEDIEHSHAIGYLVSRLGMNPVEGGMELIQGSTRSYGMLRYPGRRDNNVAPVNGFYRFTIRAGSARGANGEIPRMILTHSHPNEEMKTLLEVNVDAPWDQPQEYSVVVSRDTLGGELQVRMENETDLYMSQRPGEHFMRRNRELGESGDFAETIRLDGRKIAEGWGGDRSTPDPGKLDTSSYPRLFLDYLEVEGPLYEQWPPKSHTSLFQTFDESHDPLQNARSILNGFLPKAWRRPVDSFELEPILKLMQSELDHGETFYEAMRVGLCAALVSPKFLYLSKPVSESSGQRIGDYELASRLSYFLWNSMPDAELFERASAGDLGQQETLIRQVDRMLADPKMERFVQGFARQWLRTDTFLAFAPDQNIYRQYDRKLGLDSVEEAHAFFRMIFEEDLSVLNFIDSDLVMVNDRLAKHYDIPDVVGEAFRKVNLPPNSPRGGLLGMMGVHLAGADGIRTKPVSRAVYIREVLFNDPPDPPPPNAGEVEPNIKGENLTVRDRLLQHQEIETCAACHRSLDPYGLALENFNAIGKWRQRQDGESFRGERGPEIDVSGTLPNGESFDTFEAFRSHLLDQSDRFRRALAGKMLIYALGRPIEPTDDTLLQQAVASMRDHGDTLRSLIVCIVTSSTFLNK